MHCRGVEKRRVYGKSASRIKAEDFHPYSFPPRGATLPFVNGNKLNVRGTTAFSHFIPPTVSWHRHNDLICSRSRTKTYSVHPLSVSITQKDKQQTCVAKLSSSSSTHLPALSALRNTPSHHANRAPKPPPPALPPGCSLGVSAGSASGTGRSDPKRSETSVCSERFILTSCNDRNRGG